MSMLRWAQVFGSAVLTAGMPIIVSDYILSHHALSAGRHEASDVAQRYVEHAEGVVSEGLALLGEIRKAGHASCSYDDRMAYGRAAFASDHVQQIGVVDITGTVLCGEPMGSLVQPVRLPAGERGDPSVMLGILTGAGGDRQAVVTLKLDDDRRLVARFSRRSLDISPGASFLRDHSTVEIYLEDGSHWLKTEGKWSPASDPDAIVETVTSSRYPLKAIVSASSEAAESTVAPLRAIVIVLSTLTGLGVFALSLWNLWRRDEGDTFTRAVENQEFVPYYQPVVDLFTGELRGCEVLVRWQRPNGTMVPPGQFLPYAEATGAIREITRQLMAQTVEDCGELYARHPSLKLSINLTAMHFNDLEIMEEIREIYGNSGIRYEQLCFEVTEQHPLKDLNLSRAIIGRIQALGASVALDDVGTGHGGLAYLQKLGVDIIKIDKMFIDNIGTDHSSQTIVDTLVELGNQLGLGIIAEGVERPDQVEHLKGIGVATAQGYLWAPPLPAKAYLEMAWNQLGRDAAPADAAVPDEPAAQSAAPDGASAASALDAA
jgi:sensor c-di-GMP phosphodiesterase-like protein